MILSIKAVKGVALDVIVPCYDGEWSSEYVSAPAAVDSEVSQDKGSLADCTNEWTEIDTSGIGYLTITAAEMDCELVVVDITSTTEGANFPLIEIHTYEEPVTAVGSAGIATVANSATITTDSQTNTYAETQERDGSTLGIKGSVVITGGSGYANLTDKPSALSGINGTEGAKLSGIADGADVTSVNTAAAISGQGSLATQNNVAWGDLDTTIIDGGYIKTGRVDASRQLQTQILVMKFMINMEIIKVVVSVL